jgi:sialic acid synthase SpsE
MMKKIRIGTRMVGNGEPCFISFEPSATYRNLEEAKIMIKSAALAGADGIKFQTFFPSDSERILGKKDLKVDFSTPTGKKQESMLDAIKRRELTKDEWKELVNYSRELGITFISTPYFLDTVDFLAEIGADAIKVNKGDINNVLLVEKIARTGLPVLLDGREKFEDVERAIKICEENNNKQIIIMHCPSGYPAESAGVHLNAIKEIQKKYDYPVGFADHSLGDIMNYAAVALGVNILEKTLTLDKTREQSEHYMSLEPKEIGSFIQNIRSIEEAMGDPNILKSSRVSEDVRRSFVTTRFIKKGELITLESVDFKRPGNAGISCSEGFSIINKKAVTNIPAGTFLKWEMLEGNQKLDQVQK